MNHYFMAWAALNLGFLSCSECLIICIVAQQRRSVGQIRGWAVLMDCLIRESTLNSPLLLRVASDVPGLRDVAKFFLAQD